MFHRELGMKKREDYLEQPCASATPIEPTMKRPNKDKFEAKAAT
jgi:hypothetical protein